MSKIKVELLDWWGDDRTIAESAWASSHNQEVIKNKTEEQVDKVIDILVIGGHDTPKESVWLKFYLELPIFCERQIDKYRCTQQYQDIQIEYQFGKMGRDSITQNELSGRYRTLNPSFIGMPNDVVDIICQANYGEYGEGYDGDDALATKAVWKQQLEKQYEQYQTYLDKLKNGLEENKITQEEYKRAREFLRGMLGTGYITNMQLVMNLNAFEHILNQRLSSDAQPETRQVAQMMLQEVIDKGVAPKTIQKMIEENKWKLGT
jgi:thymidylate synthase ThyX